MYEIKLSFILNRFALCLIFESKQHWKTNKHTPTKILWVGGTQEIYLHEFILVNI